jgi:hypothetical protein
MTRHPREDVGTTLAGRFQITGVLGEGGMAVAYRAVDLKHDRPAAVKVLQADETRSEEFRKRFEREAKLADHAFHPHILPIWDSGDADGVFYIAMPLADYDLRAVIEQNPHGIEPRRAMRIIAQIGYALDFAHERHIVHRDVKPENILVIEQQTAGEYAYLADFGIAKDVASDEKLTGTRFVPMSPSTAAPEQITGEGTLDGRIDQYALACTLYHALCGRPPFVADSTRDMLVAHLFQDAPPASTVNAALPIAINNVLARGMAKAPEDRFESCQELVTHARSALGVDLDELPETPPRDVAVEEDPNKTFLDPGRLAAAGAAGARTAVEDMPPPLPPDFGRTVVEDIPAPDPNATRHVGEHDRDGDGEPVAWYRRTPVVVGALVAVAVIGVVVALAAGGGGKSKAATDRASAGPAAVSPATTTTTTPPTTTGSTTTAPPGSTTPDPGSQPHDGLPAPSSGRYRQADMTELWKHIPYDRCSPIRWSGGADVTAIGTEPPGATAAIKCGLSAGHDLTAYYLMFNTDNRMNSAFRSYINGGAFGHTYDVRERSCGGRRAGTAEWGNGGHAQGHVDCVATALQGGGFDYGVVWTAPAINVLSLLQDSSSMRTTYRHRRASGPLL